MDIIPNLEQGSEDNIDDCSTLSEHEQLTDYPLVPQSHILPHGHHTL